MYERFSRFKDPGLTEEEAEAVLLQMEKNLQTRRNNLSSSVDWFLSARFNRKYYREN
jgi:hypothetical protein